MENAVRLFNNSSYSHLFLTCNLIIIILQEIDNIVSVNDTAYYDLGKASESANHDTHLETKLVSQ